MNSAATLMLATGSALAVDYVLRVRGEQRLRRAARAQIGLGTVEPTTKRTNGPRSGLVITTMALGVLGLGTVGAAGIALAIPPIPVARALSARRRHRRHEALDKALSESLQMMIDQLAVGRDLTSALSAISKSAPPPLNEVIGGVMGEVRLGVPLHQALAEAAREEDHPQLVVFSSAVGLHSQHGGSITEILASLAETLDAEDQLKKDVETLTAEGRLSAQVLLALPVAALCLLAVMNPGYSAVLLTTPQGRMLSAVGLTLGCVGSIWLRSLSRLGSSL